MTNEVVTNEDPKPNGAVALTGLASLAQYAQEAAELEAVSSERISTKAGVFRYRDSESREMDVVIAGQAYQHAYYTAAYDEDNPSGAVCFAMANTDPESMQPHPDSPEPQSDYCKTCPRFKWGSGRKGKGKACSETRQLALLPAAAATSPDAARDADLVLIKTPVMSVKNYSNYVSRLNVAYKLPPFAVITKMASVPDTKSQFRITFALKEVIGGGDMATIKAIHKRTAEANAAALAPPSAAQDQDERPAPEAPAKGSRKFA